MDVHVVLFYKVLINTKGFTMTIYKYLFAIFIMLISYSAFSYNSCQNVYDPNYGIYRTQCTAGVNFNQFQSYAFQNQYQSQWCWAATISMVFAHSGYQVDQHRIVNEAYGGITNLPAQGWQLTQNLNRSWIDDSGSEFSSRVSGLYDASQGVVGISDAQIINQLSNGKPLIIGSNGHAMVLTEVSYYLNDMGGFTGYVYAAVFDPWPGRGPRYLTPQEFTRVDFGTGGTMEFLASAVITGSSSDGSSGGNTSVFFMLLLLSIATWKRFNVRACA